jgi:hypothetical protein
VPSDRARDGLAAPARVLTIAFALRSLRQLRFYQSLLELLTERGHRVTLMVEARRREVDESEWLERMAAHENFTYRRWQWNQRDPRLQRAKRIGAAMEYVHFKLPRFRDKQRYLLHKKAPVLVRALVSLPGVRTRLGLSGLYGLLSLLDRSNPQPDEPRKWLGDLRPDVVVVGDTGCRGGPGPFSVAFTVAGVESGIPTLGCVSSWDNLTTRPRLRALPHRLAVWNELQLEEAESIHRVPRERVVVTGAPGFDTWFDWEPRPREEFVGRVGLPTGRPVILWVCSCVNLWEPEEPSLVIRWLEALRSSPHPVLRDAGVIVRPHPLRLAPWAGVDLSGLGPAVVWPSEDLSFPTSADARAEYFDSIYHSEAVVGINTSAMIEASIVGRPVLSFVDEAYDDSQFGALHFQYLLDASGGALRLAPSLEEHTEDLARLLTGGDPDAGEASRRFVARFVRPDDLTLPATSRLVGAIESLADLRVEPVTESWPVRVVRVLGAAVSTAWTPIGVAWTPVRALYDPVAARRFRRARKQLRKRVRRRSRGLHPVRLARKARKRLRRLNLWQLRRAGAAGRQAGSVHPAPLDVPEDGSAERQAAVGTDVPPAGRLDRVGDASRRERTSQR